MSCVGKKKKGRIKFFLNQIKFEIRRINFKAALIGGVCVLAGGLISFFAGGSPTYLFHMLKMPESLPTRWVFKLVWTLSYFLIGAAFSAVLSFRERCKELFTCRGNLLFVIMMLFNYIWYPLFFGAEAVFLAFVACAAMLILDFFVACYYFKVSVICGSLMFLHLLWLLYMFWLNAAVLIIN